MYKTFFINLGQTVISVRFTLHPDKRGCRYRLATDCKIYFSEQATVQIEHAEQLITVGTKAPIGFFAYPGKVSEFYPEGCEIHSLADVHENGEAALEIIAQLYILATLVLGEAGAAQAFEKAVNYADVTGEESKTSSMAAEAEPKLVVQGKVRRGLRNE